MKKLLLALFLVFTLPLSAEEQPAVPTADEQAAALINAQEWFRLEARYPEIRDELSPFVRLLCEASLGNSPLFRTIPDCHQHWRWHWRTPVMHSPSSRRSSAGWGYS